jgi:hypothetical protein
MARQWVLMVVPTSLVVCLSSSAAYSKPMADTVVTKTGISELES